VIQANPKDREKTEYYSRWRFEVTLAIDDPTVKGKLRPKEMEADFPIFSLGDLPPAEWRCASCYRNRYKTCIFGMNEAGAKVCEHCGLDIERAGWSLYMRYKALPKYIRHRIQKSYGAKILNILKTRWPDAEVQYEDEDHPPSC
jgi:hypothetical protein